MTTLAWFNARGELRARGFRAALVNAANLVVLGLALGAAAALRSPALFALGIAAYAVLVGWDLAPSRLAAAPEAVRASARAIGRARRELARVIADAPASRRADLSRLRLAAGRLEARAAELAARAEKLSAFLRRAEDAPLAACDAQNRALSDIRVERDRLGAALARIAATLEALPPNLMRLSALENSANDTLAGATADPLERVHAEVAELEQGIEILQEVSQS